MKWDEVTRPSAVAPDAKVNFLGYRTENFARLRRADSEMKHVKNKDFFDMFLRSAVAPDPEVNFS
jgi:hypothetical protein